MDKSEIANRLSEKRLRVTPQRIAILEAILNLNNHPTPEIIIDYIKRTNPGISVGTVYKVLDSLVENELIKRVKTDAGAMRFDPNLTKHHHLYCKQTDRIEDFEDEKLNELISNYLQKKGIRNFEVKDFNLEITGKFKK